VANWLLVLVGLWMAVGTVITFTVKMPGVTGFDDIEAYRAVFLHVPLAWTGCLAFLIAAGQAARYLFTRRKLVDLSACALVESGLVLTGLATITGMVFAKSQWHTAWNWDPRQTSIFFVLLIYAAYLLLRAAVEDETLRARLSAAYLILAVAPMMWLVMVYPRLAAGSLHPSQAPFEGPQWRVMFFNFAGLLGLLAVLSRLPGGIARLTVREIAR